MALGIENRLRRIEEMMSAAADGMTPAERQAEADRTDWKRIARPEQIPPKGMWTYFLYLAGRGAGKTRAACEWWRAKVKTPSGRFTNVIAATASDARDILIEGPSGVLAITPSGNVRPMSRASPG